MLQVSFTELCNAFLLYSGCGYRGKFEKFVDWRKYAAVMQTEAETLMPSCSGGGKVVVA
jgi:hypothetical protein